MDKVENMVKKTALVIAFSWLLLVAFIAVSTNAENSSVHPPSSKNMVYYPQGKLLRTSYHQIILQPKVQFSSK